MNKEFSLDSLKKAIKQRKIDKEEKIQARFEAVAKNYQQAIKNLIKKIYDFAQQIEEFEVTVEDESEIFTSPAYPGMTTKINSYRLKITLEEDFLMFDPSGKAITSALGQIEIIASKPVSFMIEKILYLVRDPRNPSGAYWGYRSIENLGGGLLPFSKEALAKLLHEIFA
jgi:hypothetical protein